MKKSMMVLAAACAVGIASAAGAAELKVGGKAPALHIDKWLQGDPIDLSAAKSDDIYVVEFWATWCGPCKMSIPHMSEMQDHFKSFKKRNVHFIGISDEKSKVVRAFLKDGWSEKMRYTVAIDKKGKTNKAWMKAAGQNGIPTAFVVQGGQVKWIGHPMDGLDIQVGELVGDKAYVKEAKQFNKLQTELMTHLQASEWKKALASANAVLALRPNEHRTALMKFQVLATKIKDTGAATKFGYKMVAGCDDAQMLNEFAWSLLTEEDYADARDLKLALKGAKKAVDLSHEKDAGILDTYARALADSGDLTGAIEWQKKALKASKEGSRMRPGIEKALKEYEDKAAQGA
ncbi:MAG: redoxin domain-containing protein [Phycisphaerae bacterium]